MLADKWSLEVDKWQANYIYCLFFAIGSLFCGILSDFVEFKLILKTIMAAEFLLSVMAYNSIETLWIFMAYLSACGFCFGSLFATFPCYLQSKFGISYYVGLPALAYLALLAAASIEGFLAYFILISAVDYFAFYTVSSLVTLGGLVVSLYLVDKDK